MHISYKFKQVYLFIYLFILFFIDYAATSTRSKLVTVKVIVTL